jgi:multicomponent Na+:H+ antiporter subunit A
MLLVVSILLVLSILSPFLYKIFRGITGWIITIIVLFSLVNFFRYGNIIIENNFHIEKYIILDSAGINLEFYLDGLGFLFGVLILAVAAIIILYSGHYYKDNELTGRFYRYFLLLAFSIFGLVTSGNLIILFIFWVLTDVSTYFLLNCYSKNEKSESSARQALTLMGFGSLAFLAGLILICISAGTFSIQELLTNRELIVFNNIYLLILVLIFLGVFTKSVQMPFHFWLPDIKATPAPVNAFIQSTATVIAGIFLLMRLNPVTGDTKEWIYILTGTGIITMIVGGFISVKQSDLNKILAYSTISTMGLIVALIGIGTQETIQAAVVFFIAHTLYKGSLFLTSGIIEKSANSRDINILSGLYKTAPFLAIISFAAAASQSGLPLFFGFYGKELTYSSSFNAGFLNILLTFIFLTGNVFMVCTALMTGVKPFTGEYDKKNIQTDSLLYISPLILSLTGIVIFFIPGLMNFYFINPAVNSVFGVDVKIELSLWNSFILSSFLVLVTLIGGYYAFQYRRYFKIHLEKPFLSLVPSAIFNNLISGLNKVFIFLKNVYKTKIRNNQKATEEKQKTK